MNKGEPPPTGKFPGKKTQQKTDGYRRSTVDTFSKPAAVTPFVDEKRQNSSVTFRVQRLKAAKNNNNNNNPFHSGGGGKGKLAHVGRRHAEGGEQLFKISLFHFPFLLHARNKGSQSSEEVWSDVLLPPPPLPSSLPPSSLLPPLASPPPPQWY